MHQVNPQSDSKRIVWVTYTWESSWVASICSDSRRFLWHYSMHLCDYYCCCWSLRCRNSCCWGVWYRWDWSCSWLTISSRMSCPWSYYCYYFYCHLYRLIYRHPWSVGGFLKVRQLCPLAPHHIHYQVSSVLQYFGFSALAWDLQKILHEHFVLIRKICEDDSPLASSIRRCRFVCISSFSSISISSMAFFSYAWLSNVSKPATLSLTTRFVLSRSSFFCSRSRMYDFIVSHSVLSLLIFVSCASVSRSNVVSLCCIYKRRNCMTNFVN